jgi:TetR/AcrR family transcriptional regulator, cholesterol catabolism regulator
LVTKKVSIVLPPLPEVGGSKLKKLEVKDRISEKADDMFTRFGIRSVSMDDIAAQLGMSKKTIYQYFTDKDELVEAVIVNRITQMQEECMESKQHAKDAVHEMFLIMERIVEQLKNMNPMIIYDLEKFHFRSFQRFAEHKNKFLAKMIEENIKWGLEEEVYRSDLNMDILSKFRIHSMMMPFDINVFPAGKYNLANVCKELLEHFVYGMVSLKGHKLIQKYKQQFQKLNQ